GLSPWQVLMAEMCLHRTRADQVVPVFEALSRLAPTPAAMLRHEERALDAMRSLGLRWRAANIIEVARTLIREFDGRVPDALLDLGALVCPAGAPRCNLCPVRRHCATGSGVKPPPQMDLDA